MSNIYEKYIKDQCSAEERKKVVERLSAKVPPVELLHFLNKYWYRLEDDKSEPDVDFGGVLNRIHHTINLKESEENRVKYSLLHRFYSWTRIAAAVIVILMASVGVWYAGRTGIFQKEVYYTVSSVRGQSSEVTLPDGSKVWLNGASTIVYSSKYGVDNRNIDLEGEGFFRVAKSSRHPFVVEVNDIEITALGTAFNVDAYYEDSPVKVTLETGRVHIKSKEKEIELKSGMQARLYDNRIEVLSVDVELYTSWYKGEIVFKNEKLKAITDQLEKLYDVEFVYMSDTLQNFRYRGTIRLDHSILKALDMLQISTGIEYNVTGNQVILDR